MLRWVCSYTMNHVIAVYAVAALVLGVDLVTLKHANGGRSTSDAQVAVPVILLRKSYACLRSYATGGG